MRKTSGGPSWSPPTAPPIPSATSLCCKLSSKRSSPPPNISIAFEKKTRSSSKAIAQALNKQFTACSAQHDRALRRPMRDHHRVDPSGRPFDEKGVTAVILKAGSSTPQEPDGLTVLYLRHIGEHGLAFLTELFNLLVSVVDITADWKNSVLIPILKAGKPRDHGRSYSNISLLFAAVKILERLLLPSIVEALGGTCSSHHGFKPRHWTASAMLLISARVVSGFSQRKFPSRTIAIAVDISKAFDTVSHSLLIEMIHRSQLRCNLVRWLVAYLCGRKASCLYQQHNSPPL